MVIRIFFRHVNCKKTHETRIFTETYQSGCCGRSCWISKWLLCHLQYEMQRWRQIQRDRSLSEWRSRIQNRCLLSLSNHPTLILLIDWLIDWYAFWNFFKNQGDLYWPLIQIQMTKKSRNSSHFRSWNQEMSYFFVQKSDLNKKKSLL